MTEQLTHTRSCNALTPGETCTCCLQERQNTQTAETMHAAWRKRAEEAEMERDRLAECLSDAVKMTEAAWSELSYRERAELKPTLDCWRAALKTPNVEVTGSPALSASPSGLPGYAGDDNGETK